MSFAAISRPGNKFKLVVDRYISDTEEVDHLEQKNTDPDTNSDAKTKSSNV